MRIDYGEEKNYTGVGAGKSGCDHYLRDTDTLYHRCKCKRPFALLSEKTALLVGGSRYGALRLTVFIGSAYAYRKHAHLGVDILINILPEKIRKVVKVLMDLLELATLIMLTRTSVQYVMNTMDKLTNTLRVPSWYISSAVPIGFGLSLIFCIYFLLKDLIRVFKKGGGDE